MPDKKLVKCSVRVYADDLEIVRDHYPDLGYNRLIRHIISKMADRIRQGRQDAVTEMESLSDEDFLEMTAGEPDGRS